eukprot:5783029-Lingulodinium_polyedra.AAC.1
MQYNGAGCRIGEAKHPGPTREPVTLSCMTANVTSFYTAGKWIEKSTADVLLLQETHVTVEGVRSAAA